MTVQRMGFIGLGVMGGPMAGHLAAAGHQPTVYDLSPQATGRLKDLHPDVTIVATPAAVAAASDIVITMLPSGKEVREVALGEGGLIEGFKSGSLLLDTSSAEPWHTREVAARLAEKGVAMVDAPVSGAEAGSKAAELVFMVGGEAADVARVLPILEILGKAHFHLGPVGSGHVMKSINNLISAITLTATAEGLIEGVRHGLDPVVMNDVLDVSTGMSWVSQTHFRQRVFNRRFDDAFKFDLMKKDIDIANTLATEVGLEPAMARLVQRLWKDIQDKAPKGASISHLVRAMEAEAGVELAARPVGTGGPASS